MLLIDSRDNYADWMKQQLGRFGVQADVSRLEYGDFAFVGRGLHNTDVFVGVELKRIGAGDRSDLLASLYSTRFAGHQLIGLAGEHAIYDRAWLITEGIWRSSATGELEVFAKGWRPVRHGSRSVMSRDIQSWILTQVIRGGVLHWHCSTRDDTVMFLSVLYHWWTDKSLDEHRSHQAIYLAPPDRAMMAASSQFLKTVSTIEGVGWEKGRALEEQFKTPHDDLSKLILATQKELKSVNGVGPVIAGNIHKVFHGPTATSKK